MLSLFKLIQNKIKLICWSAGFACFGISAASVLEPYYLTAKAKMAQILLTTAWQKSLSTSDNVKPWPWADFSPELKVSVIFLDEKTKRQEQQRFDFIVLDNASGESLAFGPGMMRPKITASGLNSRWIAGHKDTHFSVLESVQPGDLIETENKQGEIQRYRIDTLQVVDINKEYQYSLDLVDTLTLVTCYPFEKQSQPTPFRLLVNASRIKPKQSSESSI